ncbi:MAG: autotransporter outer membrane beta-barrel domain-containing protein [Puniceicoccales bacterium]|nr:autotransporter outer membrane beta-barrel domain-containing protein [Puniceicoccales bacterium]
MGNLGTLHRTGDFHLDYDKNTGAMAIDGFVGLDDLYIRSDDGRLLLFSDNSFYMKLDMILALEPVLTINHCYSEYLTAICNTYGYEYDVGEVEILSKTVAKTLGNRIAKVFKSFQFEYDDLSDYDIVLLEILLDEVLCPYHLESSSEKMAELSVAAHTLVTNALSDRMTSVKGCLADPFVHAIYGHAHQNEIAQLGYSNHMGGLAIGLDNIWTFPNERYLRLGAVFGYVHGKTNFFGAMTNFGMSSKHDIYTLESFGVYELFNDQHLKTNIGITLGCSYGSDKLHRKGTIYLSDIRLRSNSIFVGLEFVKNLCAYNGYQFGLWFRTNYSHIAQKKYEAVTATSVHHVPSINHNFLTTVVGVNVEREIFKPKYADEKLTLSLKIGWECQPIRKHSDMTITFNNRFISGRSTPILGQPSKHAAIASFGAIKKLNTNWNIVGSYIARFNGDISTHNLYGGIEYSF